MSEYEKEMAALKAVIEEDAKELEVFPESQRGCTEYVEIANDLEQKMKLMLEYERLKSEENVQREKNEQDYEIGLKQTEIQENDSKRRFWGVLATTGASILVIGITLNAENLGKIIPQCVTRMIKFGFGTRV